MSFCNECGNQRALIRELKFKKDKCVELLLAAFYILPKGTELYDRVKIVLRDEGFVLSEYPTIIKEDNNGR